MFKYKKYFLYVWDVFFIVLFIIELIKYLMLSSEIFGLIYLLINIFMIFLLVPLTYNYKKIYSKSRVSKMILIIILGIFNSYILNIIISSSLGYVDESSVYLSSIFIIKNILKGILYFLFLVFTIIESRILNKVIKKG